MDKVGTGPAIYELRKKIQDIKTEIELLGDFAESPELIESANLLRSNEYLGKKTQKQAELADAYTKYAQALEGMLADVFEIQHELVGVLRGQSVLLSDKKAVGRRKKPAPLKDRRHRRQ